LVGWQEGHPACKKIGGWWRWALLSLDGVALSWMVSVSASVNLPLHHKAQRFSSGTDSPGWSWKNGHKIIKWLWYGGGMYEHLVGHNQFQNILRRVAKFRENRFRDVEKSVDRKKILK